VLILASSFSAYWLIFAITRGIVYIITTVRANLISRAEEHLVRNPPKQEKGETHTMGSYVEYVGFKALDERHTLIVDQLEKIMAKVTDVAAQVADLKTKVTAALQRIAEDVNKLKADVAAGQIDAAALDAISTNLADVIASVDAIDPLPENPAPLPGPVTENS
jgi:methyl-accepting chemotaxis protein